MSTTLHAAGSFDVKVTPQANDAPAEGATLGRMSLDKRFHGELDATSTGVMITAMSPVKGSAAYSAVERVSGVLNGRAGTFALQHTGIMNRGVPSLVITVVPDSGTGELAGLAGAMSIKIEGAAHSYAFDYTLGESA